MSTAFAVLLALCCSALWAVANVYVQRAGRSLGGLRAMFWAQGAASVGLVAFSACFEPTPTMPPWSDLTITAAGSAVGYYAMMVAFATGTLGGVVPIIAAWAFPAAVVGVLWSGDRPTGVEWVGAGMILVGVVGNGAIPAAGPREPVKLAPMLWAAAGAVGFGVMVAGTARLRTHLGPIGVIPAVWAAQWVLLSPVVAVRREIVRPPSSVQWPMVLGMGLFEATGFVAFTVASRFAPVAVVSPPASLSSVLTVLYASAVLGERAGPLRWALVVLAAVGTIVVGSG